MHSRMLPLPSVSDPDSARLARYRDALAFYEGRQWDERPRRGETRLTVNYARTLVRKVASYVFPAAVSFSVPPQDAGDAGSAAAAHRAELVLAALGPALGLDQLDLDLAIESTVLGDAVMKVTWDVSRDGGSPVVAAVDPAAVSAWWAPDNPRRLIRVAHGYALPGDLLPEVIPEVLGSEMPAIGTVRARPELASVDPDQLYPVVEEWTGDRWRVTVAGQLVRDEPNPYGWIPYVIVANNPRPHESWGTSDLDDLVDVCRELNRRLSVLGRILDVCGAPITVLENVDGSDGITVGPGAKWELPEGARAYLLDLLGGGGIGLHIDYINLLYRSLHDLSETPRTAFGDSGRDLSGVALEVEIQPLIQQVNRKRRGWEAAFRARNWRLLDLCERFGGADLGGHRVSETIWPDVLPSDTSSTIQDQVRLVSAGIRSRRTAISDLGANDPDAELTRIEDEMVRFVARLP